MILLQCSARTSTVISPTQLYFVVLRGSCTLKAFFQFKFCCQLRGSFDPCHRFCTELLCDSLSFLSITILWLGQQAIIWANIGWCGWSSLLLRMSSGRPVITSVVWGGVYCAGLPGADGRCLEEKICFDPCIDPFCIISQPLFLGTSDVGALLSESAFGLSTPATLISAVFVWSSFTWKYELCQCMSWHHAHCSRRVWVDHLFTVSFLLPTKFRFHSWLLCITHVCVIT